ncbi:MerR family transcriptional regulator [Reticulibacter mediterranei]|uniref:MerR family transcriptional regulator n=1 Tax=Reticulibacter mediterranei TaxID=2778369 RepID=A0A8J3IYA4_9CHLR|nr:MerR family transcriptional regulator [Reticulibacter mediterranei]GHO98982.1 MerR family transcriptional regulator [Reticulibacter mediterranei]
MFSIGEFSRIARVSPRQLRHYEALGLFQPERIDPETGYRFYSALQLPRLNRILALKDLGLTLPQIRRLLDANISAEEIRGMLTMRKAQIEQTLHEELERMRSIEARIFQVEEQGFLTDDVVLKSIPSRNFLSLRQVLPSKEQGFALMAQIFHFLPRRIGRGASGQFALLFSQESFETENIDVEMGFMCDEEALEPVPLSDGRVMTVHPLPAVENMATMIHIGIAHHERCYGTLGIWIEQNHYQLAGPGREVFIEPLQPAKLEEAVIEIQLPVTRANQDHPALTTK